MFIGLDQDDDIKMSMEQVKFSCRHAVALMYNENIQQINDLSWSVKYFPNDPVVSFAAIDNRRRGWYMYFVTF